MARPKNRIKNKHSLSNLKKDKNGEITFGNLQLYEYERSRATGRLSPSVELKRIGLCLEEGGLTKRERDRLYYRIRKLTNRLPIPRQTKNFKILSKMNAHLSQVEKELRKEGLMP